MYKILIAPDSFKDSISSVSLTQTLVQILSNYILKACPFADGGENSLKVIQFFNHELEEKWTKTFDPLGREIDAFYLYNPLKKEAYFELAQSTGLERLTQKERDPMNTSSFGTGWQIKQMLDETTADKIYLFIGSSSTNDGGAGIADALGVKFYDEEGKEIDRMTGESLSQIDQIKIPNQNIPEIVIACDVNNLLCGPLGAAYSYGKQKGASEEQIVILDQNLHHFSQKLMECTQIDISQLEGSGAAGGVGAGLYGIFGAQLKSGFEVIREITHLDQMIKEVDILITGEGSLDQQTFSGKLVGRISGLAKAEGIPVLCICGQNKLDRSSYLELGINEVLCLSDYFDTEDISENKTVQNLMEISDLIKRKIVQLIND